MAKPTHASPKKIVLATDLSARCDRALDRAVQLAGEWRSKLVVMTVVETPARVDPLAVPTWPPAHDHEARRLLAKRQLQRDAASLGMPTRIRIEQGDTARAIADAAAEESSGLIVTGMARNELLGRFLVGSTVEQLARTVSQPVLVVRNRVHDKYRRLLVATDFSEASRHAMESVVRLFPGRELIVYHAHAGSLAGAADGAVRRQISRRIEREEVPAFLAASELAAGVRQRARIVVGVGGLEMSLGRFVRDHEVDLAVLGTRGRRGLSNLFLGSAAARLLHWLPCDTMLVRQPQASARDR